MESMLWTELGQVCTENLSDMLKALCINVVLEAVPMRMYKPAAKSMPVQLRFVGSTFCHELANIKRLAACGLTSRMQSSDDDLPWT